MSSSDLPVYQFKSALPVKAVDRDGKDAMLPDDPYFLLGNYRTKLFVHSSGRYQFLTGERAWARINATEQANYGWNESEITFDDTKGKKKRILTGINSISADTSLVHKQFGVGFAKYNYAVDDGIQCTRIISVKPSLKINTGNPSFIVTVQLKNSGKKNRTLTYKERMVVNYQLVGTQFFENKPLSYKTKISVDKTGFFAVADLSCQQNAFLHFPQKSERYIYDIDPPSVFMYSNNANVKISGDTLATEIQFVIKPGQVKTYQIVIGINDRKNFASVQKQIDDLWTNAEFENPSEGLFAMEWKRKLPDFSAEKDVVLKREMLWNAHVLEALANYSDYYKETYIPQGTVYSFHFGDNISNRDHMQAALPACYTNPALAKSSIRYVIKHSETDGEIKRGNAGYGYTPPSIYKESDEQLYFFNTLSEYLLITKDYAFLNEWVGYYPAESEKQDVLLTILKKYFIYLRDEIGTGQNGLVKLLNSDWSDSFLHEYSPNKYSWSAESHLNSAMVLAILPKLITALKQSENQNALTFIDALEKYRASIEKAFMADLDDRKFAARAYLNDRIKFGLDKVCIEPQGYLLQIPELSKERKVEIYNYVKEKVFKPEKIGFRTRETPIWGKPDGEDGGIWYSLEYAMLIGVSTFDKEEAKRLLKKMSFDNFAESYPDYWVGQWTAPDNINSTLSGREGLYHFWEPYIRRSFQGYCSHPHTWPLFCYFKLKE